jgi:hypothetical protein
MLSFWHQSRPNLSPFVRTTSNALAITLGYLALMRLIYEWLFPLWDWTGRIEIVVPLAILVFVGAIYLKSFSRLWWLSLPLFINLLWLFNPAVELIQSRIVFSTSLWLISLIWLNYQSANSNFVYLKSLFTLVLVIPISTLYLLTISHSVGFADTFEFQVTAPKLGIVHPTGYPLYLIFGKLWTLIPLYTTAWRLNFGTALYAVFAAVATFHLLIEVGRNKDELPALQPWIEPVAITAAALLVTLPVVWSQAIAAEVYTLHLLIASASLLLMNRLLTNRIEWGPGAVWLALLLGLGMTNHVTTVFLLPASALVMWWGWPKNNQTTLIKVYLIPGLRLAASFAAPLILYLYLPLRWQAVNGEPMGAGRFFSWIVGGRFQGALQFRAIFDDPQRFRILGQLLLDQWPIWLLILAAVGVVTLLLKHWRMGVALLITTAGFAFYTLSYYVPDLAVFMLPIHLAIAIFCGFGLMSCVGGASLLIQRQKFPAGSLRHPLLTSFPLLLLIPLASMTAQRYPTLDLSADDGRETWAQAVLSQDLAQNSAILADSEKHPPLYYVQQIENLRPDLDLMILPDEVAYRAELDRRIAAGETIYLARFLPQLAGVYNLQAAGPLTQVSAKEFALDPKNANKPAIASFGGIDLIDVQISEQSPFDPAKVGVDLEWRINEIPNEQLKVFLRWKDQTPLFPAGRLPVNDFLPFNGADQGDVIKDFYLLPAQNNVELQISIAPAFKPASEIAWQTISDGLQGANQKTLTDNVQDIRLLAVDRFNNPLSLVFEETETKLTHFSLPESIKPGPLPQLVPLGIFQTNIEAAPGTNLQPQKEQLAIFITAPFDPSFSQLRCGWLQWPKERCFVGTITVSGVALPADAINYADKIALLDSAVNGTVTAGGQLEVETTWQGLEQIDEDYTIFLQVLSENDQIIGQLDVKPAQGTRPTNLWEPGERLTDNYTIPLSMGVSVDQSYRLIIGFYRLSDFQRLAIIDLDGAPVADHFSIPLK